MVGAAHLSRIRIIPRRCAWGGALVFAGAAQTSLGLYNNSAGADLLMVWGVCVSDDGGSLTSLGFKRGALANFIQNAIPVLAGSVGIPGALYSEDSATIPPTMYYFGSGSSNSVGAFPTVPFAILNPGDSLVLSNFTAAKELAGSFSWQAIHPEDLGDRPCPICDGITEHTQPTKR